MNEIKFVFFDIGGVLIKDFSESPEKWSDIKNMWGIAPERSEELDKKFDDFEEDACIGKVEINGFLQILEKDFGIKVPENFSINDEFTNKFYRNEGIWKIVEECKKRGEVGLLTNMYTGMLDTIKDKKLLPEIEWNVEIDSSMVKCKKPHLEIYEIAQSETGLKAGEILFIDNKESNLVVPKSMGWKTFLYDSADYEKSNRELEEYLGKY